VRASNSTSKLSMKSLAGNRVSIFLFHFVLRKNAISFVLNESIAEDLYPEADEQLEPLVHVCGETLMRYRHLCHEEIIMDGNILEEGCFEVMLKTGLGIHFAQTEKQNLFNDAHEIAKLLIDVMDRRTLELKHGTYPGAQPIIPKIQRSDSTNKRIEALARKRESLGSLSMFDGEASGLRRLSPSDLPQGVLVRKGYDHRGRCYAFEHVTLGQLGKIIVFGVNGNTQIDAELHTGNSGVLAEKKKVFEEIISVVEEGLQRTVKHAPDQRY